MTTRAVRSLIRPTDSGVGRRGGGQMKMADMFDRAFVLNLPERSDRRREMGKVLRDAGMDWEPGKVDLFAATRTESAGTFPSRGAHGCFLSHLGILKKGRELGASRLLVMEDDLEISPRLPGLVDDLASRLAVDDWGFAFLGHHLPDDWSPGSPARLEFFDGPGIKNHFYLVNGRILDRLIAFLELVMTRSPGDPEGGPMHVDGAYTVFRQQNPDVRALISHPNLGWQRSSQSDITTNWVDQYPVLSDFARIARQVKRRLGPRQG